LFDDDRVSSSSSIISRLGGRDSPKGNRFQDISVENLHYDVTEKDLVELFSTVADVVKARLVFDTSGRSTGVATVTYNTTEDAEKAIKKYNNIELDGKFTIYDNLVFLRS
jgi:THO complex subunit 4